MDSRSLEHSFFMCVYVCVLVCSCLQESFVLVVKPFTRLWVEDSTLKDHKVKVKIPLPDTVGQRRRSTSSLNCVLSEWVVGILLYNCLVSNKIVGHVVILGKLVWTRI